jgi:4-hydroxyphenylpyruvate dioxygenase
LCQGFGILTLVIAADFDVVPDASAMPQIIMSLKQAAQWASAFDVRLALELRGRSPFCASLDTAVALVAQCGEANLGICLDLFHYYTGPSKFEDLGLLTPGNLFLVQACDLSGVPRELATDSDRVFPGDGDFQLTAIAQQLHNMGYDGWLSLELLNPALWQAKPEQVADLGLRAMQRWSIISRSPHPGSK